MPARQARLSATAIGLNLSTANYLPLFGIRQSTLGIHNPPMLDIRLIREQPDFVKSRLATRGGDDAAKIDEVLRVDVERRKAETTLQQCNADRKRFSKEIGGKRAKGEATDDIEARVREIGNEIARLSEQTTATDEQQKALLLGIPNLPHESVPVGKDPSENPVIRSWGEKPELKQTLDHVALGTKLKLFDL